MGDKNRMINDRKHEIQSAFKPPNKRERVCSLSSLTNSIVKRSFFLTTPLSLSSFFFFFFFFESLSLFKTSINKKNPKKRKKKKEKRSKPLLSINSFSNDNEALTRYGHFFSVLSLFFSLPRSLSLSFTFSDTKLPNIQDRKSVV